MTAFWSIAKSHYSHYYYTFDKNAHYLRDF